MKRSSEKIGLLLVGGSFIPLLLLMGNESRNCYSTQQECHTDWTAVDCELSTTEDQARSNSPAGKCNYLGRSHYGFFNRTGNYRTSNSNGSVTRSGFGSIGRSFSSGSS